VLVRSFKIARIGLVGISKRSENIFVCRALRSLLPQAAEPDGDTTLAKALGVLLGGNTSPPQIDSCDSFAYVAALKWNVYDLTSGIYSSHLSVW
jgi:hypothetical protein